MGRIIHKRVIGFRCEVRACSSQVRTLPADPGTGWVDQIADLYQMVDGGWAVVLNSAIRCYCPEHAVRVYDCTCRTNKAQQHLCVEHDEDAASRLWVAGDTPAVVAEELEKMGALQ